MKNLLKSLLETSKERIKNPFIGAFVLSWFIINWKPILVLLFSDKRIEDRIIDITKNYTNTYSNLYLPIIIAFIYVILLPYLMWLIEEVLKKSIIGRKKNIIKQRLIDIKGKQELAVEESELENIKANFRDKADLNNQIEKLTLQLNDREKTIESQRIGLNTLNEDYAQLKLIFEKDKTSEISQDKLKRLNDLYLKFKDADLYEYFREIGIEIRKRNQFPNRTNDIIREKYLYDGIIERIDDKENQSVYYKFTEKGNYFWKKYIMNLRVVKKDIEPEFDPEDFPF